MASLIIPTPANGYPDQTVQVPLNGVTYTIRWQWLERAGSWFFSIGDKSGPLLTGVRVAVNCNLLAYTADPRKPNGSIIPIAPDYDESDPGLNDLGTRVQIVLTDAADIAAVDDVEGEEA